MKKLVGDGKVRAIGVSNFGIADLKPILPHAEDVPISCNQIEVHPWLPNSEVISFARDHGTITSCFSPFAGQKKDGSTLVHDPTVRNLANKNDMDVGQLLQSWAVQRGTVPLGKSQNEGPSSDEEVVEILIDQQLVFGRTLQSEDYRLKTTRHLMTWKSQTARAEQSRLTRNGECGCTKTSPADGLSKCPSTEGILDCLLVFTEPWRCTALARLLPF